MNLPRNPVSFGRGGKSVMDFRPSQALASGLKRVGGRSGIARLGRSPIARKMEGIRTRGKG